MAKRSHILKGLILFGLIAIIISIFIQYGVPYIDQQRFQKLDEQRINDLNTLNEAVQAVASSSAITLGEPETVYLSLSSDNRTCSDLNLPPLPTGWQYRCVASSELQNTDGTGWLPIDLKNLKESQTIGLLPIDPINNANSHNYYAFVTNGVSPITISIATTTKKAGLGKHLPYAFTAAVGSEENIQYVLTGALDSTKYLRTEFSTSSDIDPTRYILGNSKLLWAQAIGIIEDLPINDGSGTLLKDLSGQNKNATSLEPDWIQKGCLLESCEELSSKNKIVFPTPLDFSADILGTFMFWFKLNESPISQTQIFNPGASRFDVNLEQYTGKIYVWSDNGLENNLVYKSDEDFIDHTWHQIAISKDINGVGIFIDGSEVYYYESTQLASSTLSNGFAVLDSLEPDAMLINDIRFYNNNLSNIEIQKIYDSRK